MKKFYSLVAVVVMAVVNAQVVIFSENMGNTTSTKTIENNTFQNAAPIAFSGSAEVRGTSSSSGYDGASGGANVMINANGEYFQISGIDTTKYDDIQLFLGQRKGKSDANNELRIEVSADGNNWVMLSYDRPTGKGTANWLYINPAGVIPSVQELYIKFTGTNTTEWRIDDIKLVGNEKVMSVVDLDIVKETLVKNTVVVSEVSFLKDAKVQIINLSGQVVKSASVKENQSLNVSELPKGVYIVTGVVDGKAVSQKIIKK